MKRCLLMLVSLALIAVALPPDVVADETEKKPAFHIVFFTPCFPARIAEDGSFEVVIDELDHTDGQLRIVCCFNNGAIVGRGAGLGLQSGFAKQYRFSNGAFTFDDGWAAQPPGPSGRRRLRPGGGRPNGPRRPAGPNAPKPQP